jgi:large subunit ribosomal protein L31
LARVRHIMKVGIHPKYVDTTATCACGNSIEIGCTIPDLKMDICSNCHPFYTGTHKIVDTEGRLERFKNKYAKAAQAKK